MGRSFARFLHCLENWTLADVEPNVARHHKQQQRQNERQAPCPGLPCFRADDRFCPQYYKNGQNKAARDACLDETGKITASVLRRMFADINGRASIFPAKSEPLNNTQTNDDDWSSGTDRRFGRSETHTSEHQSLMRISSDVSC